MRVIAKVNPEMLAWLRDRLLDITQQPDLILGKNGITLLAEVKTGNGKLRPGQKTWHDDWRGSKPWILRDVEDVLVLNQWSTAASTERSSPFDARTAYLKWRQAAPDSRQPSKPGNITTEVIRKRNGRRTSRLAAND